MLGRPTLCTCTYNVASAVQHGVHFVKTKFPNRFVFPDVRQYVRHFHLLSVKFVTVGWVISTYCPSKK